MNIYLDERIPLSLQDFVVIIFVSIACYTDLKYRKIYDKMTYPTMTLGLLLGYVGAAGEGVMAAGLGMGVAVAVFIIPCELGAVGGGDGKMMMAVGALRGYQFLLVATCIGFALGAVQAVYMIGKRPDGFMGFIRSITSGSLFYTSIEDRKNEENVPLGVYFAVGTILTVGLSVAGVYS